MPVMEKQRIKISSRRRMVRGLVALVAALALLLCGLTVFTIVRDNQLRHQLAQQDSVIADLRGEMEDARDEMSALQDELEDTRDEMEAQQKKYEDKLKDKDALIDKQKKTIASLRTQISQKKTTSGKGKTTTTADQNLPERDYGDHSGEKLVALTFDDGPGPYTERLLNAMKKRGVKATFFVLGNRVDRYPDLIKRMEKEGHVVGNHSYDHPNLTRLTASGVSSNMNKTAKKVEKLIGHKPEVMRCPGGACNKTVKKYAADAGIPIIYWSVDTRDWESRNVNAIMNVSFGKNGIKDGSIVLMHDIHEPSVDAAIKMMDKLKKQGYTFVTVPELLMAREGEIVPGTVYY